MDLAPVTAGGAPGRRGAWLRRDAPAGITTAAVVIPKAMAYAAIAGLSVETGLYAACAALLAYALLGTSRQLSVSTTSTLAILTAAALAGAVAGAGPARMVAAASTLALLTGAILLLAGVLRLGFLANFISDPVLIGFKAGIGLVIVVDPLPKILGVHIDKGAFFHTVRAVVEHLPAASLPTLLLAACTLVLLFGLERLVPRAPAPLAAVVLGIAATSWLGLKAAGVALAGPIPAGIPAPAVPDLALIRTLWPAALGIALMSFTESIAAGRAFARPDDPRPVPNRELIALGAANAGSAFLHGLPAGGGTSQTAVNAQAGARTKAAGAITAMVVVACMLFLAPLIGLLPQATLAAVVVVTTLPLIRPMDFRAILRVRHTEFWWAIIACAGVVLVGTLQGILIAVAVSVLTLLHQANRPAVYEMGRKPGTDVYRPRSSAHAGDETIPGLLIVRTEGRMTFASAPQVDEPLRELVRVAKPQVVILECSAIPDFEYTALKALTHAEAKLRAMGITLWLVALNPAALRMVERSPLGPALGHERMFFNLHDAVRAYEARVQGLPTRQPSPGV